MKLIEKWNKMLSSQQYPKEFWDEYLEMEKCFYKNILKNSGKESKKAGSVKNQIAIKTSIPDLCKEYDINPELATGLIDGISESLVNEEDLSLLDDNSQIDNIVDLEKLYTNMLKVKANWLYELEEWGQHLSDVKRKEIRSDYLESIRAKSQKLVGRNDPCPCGSGKKYKKCCVNKSDN